MRQEESLTTSSLVAAAIEWYSDSADDLETVIYFLVFHEIKEPPKMTKYLVNEPLISGQAS